MADGSGSLATRDHHHRPFTVQARVAGDGVSTPVVTATAGVFSRACDPVLANNVVMPSVTYQP